jgi:hypothetical protein
VVKSDAFTPESAKPNSFRTARIFAAFSAVGRTRISTSPVKRGRACKARLCAPTIKYSTPWEFSNVISSLESLFRAMLEEFKENLETRLRSELVVEVPVGFVRFLEAAEFHNLLLHL